MPLLPVHADDSQGGVEARTAISGKRFVKALEKQSGIARDPCALRLASLAMFFDSLSSAT